MISGDFIHAVEGVTPTVVQEFVSWSKHFKGRTTVVIGNHDRPLVNRWPADWKFIELVEEVRIQNFIFQHEPPARESKTEFVWCGHIHPKIKLKFGPERLYLPAFVVTPGVGYLPAFSSLAGGADFAYQKRNRYFVASEDKTVEVTF